VGKQFINAFKRFVLQSAIFSQKERGKRIRKGKSKVLCRIQQAFGAAHGASLGASLSATIGAALT
jgi:hypothetical protein